MAADTKTDAADADPAALRDWVARARAISALLAFGLAYIVATRAGVPTADAIIRGVIAAAIFSVVGWWCALLVIQALMRAAAARKRADYEAAVLAIQNRRESEAAASSGAAAPDPSAGVEG